MSLGLAIFALLPRRRWGAIVMRLKQRKCCPRTITAFLHWAGHRAFTRDKVGLVFLSMLLPVLSMLTPILRGLFAGNCSFAHLHHHRARKKGIPNSVCFKLSRWHGSEHFAFKKPIHRRNILLEEIISGLAAGTIYQERLGTSQKVRMEACLRQFWSDRGCDR